MLRIGFLPSDFNPMLLMLGDAEDFRALGGVMRGFARAPADTRIDTMGFCVPSNTAVTLTGSAGPLGVHRDGHGHRGRGRAGPPGRAARPGGGDPVWMTASCASTR